MGSSAAAAINQVQIAPVGAASPNMMVTMPVQLSTALLGAVPQRFSGDQQDWPEWRRRWLSFVENLLDAMPNVTDTQILTIFKGVIDDASVERLEGEQFKDPDMTYEEFFASMDLEFGGEDHANLRAKWYNLRIRHAGTVKLWDWRGFSAPFFKLMAMVEDATEEEAERLMLKALPVEWRRKVEIEVSKRNQDGLMVLEGLPFNMDETLVSQFITAETGGQPKKVKVLAPGKWRVQAADEDHRKEIMKFNRQRLDSGVRLTVRLVEDRLTVKDIDQKMRRWLQVDDRVNHVSKGERDRSEDRGRRDDRQRFTRELTAEDTDSEAGVVAAVGDFGKGKPRPKSAEVHPKKDKWTEKQFDIKEAEKKVEKQPPSAVGAKTPAEPPPGQGSAVPQWTPDAQWWQADQWWGPTYWTPQWQPGWSDGKGGYGGGGYGGGSGREWGGRKGDKGGRGGRGQGGKGRGSGGGPSSSGGQGTAGEKK